ncbi:MAG: fumarylacetoacetate hydrolase family protein [Bacteroidales bacterium]|nr:fumarylacetoacetate hydrolase family protein [Bacteroidales bacterium]
MKIICIGRNYSEHAKELNNPLPEKPVFFMKADSSILKNNKPFFLPDFSKDVHYEVELVLKISKLGKNIAEKFAYRYYNEIGIGIDFTARDLQKECKSKGLPWEIAKAFENSAPLGEFLPKENFSDLNNIKFHLDINNGAVQQGNSGDMIFSFNKLISYLSQFFTLKTGDLIFTGTPAGVGPVKKNDRLQAYIEDNLLLDFKVK